MQTDPDQHYQLTNFLDQPVTPCPYDRYIELVFDDLCIFSLLVCMNLHWHHWIICLGRLSVPVVLYRSTNNFYYAWWAHVGMNVVLFVLPVKNRWWRHAIIKKGKSIANAIILSKYDVNIQINSYINRFRDVRSFSFFFRCFSSSPLTAQSKHCQRSVV